MEVNKNLSRFEKTYTNGEILFCEYETGGSKFYFIKKGEVKLTRMIDGKEYMLDILRSGVFFGEMAIIESEPRSAMAIANGDITVLEFDKSNFETIVLQNPQLSLSLIKTFVDRVIVQQQRLQIYSYDDAVPRVIMCLFNLGMLLTTESRDRKYIVNASMDDIAKWVGISSKENKAILQDFTSDNLILVEETRIIITNPHGLRRKLNVYIKKTPSN